MPIIRRLSDSCLLVTTDDGTTLFDPGFHTFDSGEVDLESIGDVQRVLITHEHSDHVKPEFVKWLLDRGSEVSVYGNEAVAEMLVPHDIDVVTDNPTGVSSEDVVHGLTPMGTQPPNRSWTIDAVLTHPGDSYEPTSTAPVLALGLLVPWGSATAAVEFARELRPQQVIPVHDFYLSPSGREWIVGLVASVLGRDNIEVVPLDWGEGYSF